MAGEDKKINSLATCFYSGYSYTYSSSFYCNYSATFSAMNIVKTRLRNKMEDDFLTDSMLLYIEREITQLFSTDSIIDDFNNVKTRRLLFSLKNAL
jgi:hypothetical protein